MRRHGGAGATGNISLINNRQSGRRRGRGGQRPPGMSGNTGHARDTRQRGNAAQLLEKYKNMARDAQLAGDRVQTEYYLQFADHYFRVLDEGRARYEEQRRQRGDDDSDDEMDESADAGDGDNDADGDDRPQRNRSRDRDDRPQRNERPQRAERPERNERPDRGERHDRPERTERPERAERSDGAENAQRSERRPRVNGRSRDAADAKETIGLDVLPPAIGVSDSVDTDHDAAPKPRRRVRKPQADEGSEAEA